MMQIIAVVPNEFGIAIYSPPLDEHGNSVRAVKLLTWLSEELQLNMFDQVC